MTSLTREQRSAANHLMGPARVIAGAGTGKTTTLANRIAFLIKKGIKPREIVALTFTRRAGNEIRQRLRAMKIKGHQTIYAGTSHSFTYKLMTQYYKEFGFARRPVVLDEPDSREVFKLIRGTRGSKSTLPKASDLLRIHQFVACHNLSVIQAVKKVSPEHREHHIHIKEIFRQYTDYKRTNDLIDFNDILLRFNESMGAEKHLRNKINTIYRFIHVDEYQDTNPIQAKVVQYLAGRERNVFVVGDNFQAIYSFTGATVENIEKFHKLFRGSKRYFLTHNFRSTQKLLDLSNAIMTSSKSPLKKNLISSRGPGTLPQFMRPSDEGDEAVEIADQIEILIREKSLPPSEIGVLYRSGWQSTLLEIELNNRKIPYRKFGGKKVTETAHFKIFLSTLKIMSNLGEDISWIRVLTLLDRIGEKAAVKFYNHFKDTGTLLSKDLKIKLPKATFSALRKIDRVISASLENLKAFDAAMAFVRPLIAEHFPEDWKKRLKELKTLPVLLAKQDDIYAFISDLTLNPIHQKDSPERNETVTISTVHSAKGLEWGTVFILGVLDGVVPSKKSKTKKEIEEERRVLYVALTRAKDCLILSIPSFVDTGWMFLSRESRFLKGLKESLHEEISSSMT